MSDKDKTESKVFKSIKGKYKSNKQGVYGLFLIFLDEEDKKVKKASVLATSSSPVYEMPVSSHWTSIDQKIMDMKWKGQQISQTSANLEWVIDNTLKEEHVFDDILDVFNAKNKAGTEQKILEMFRRFINDSNIDFEVEFEMITSQAFENYEKTRTTKKEVKKHEAISHDVTLNVPSDAILIDVFLVISPLLGIPIQELKVGEWIMVRVDDTKPKGRNFLTSINPEHTQGQSVPIPALIHQIEHHPDDSHTIIIKLGENVYGKIFETERVKVRKFEGQGFFYDGSTDLKAPVETQDDEYQPASIVKDKMLIALFIGVILLAVALFIFLFYY